MSEAGIPETASSSSAPAPGRSFVERVTGVLRLDASAYDEAGADPAALGQAAAVVLAAAAAGAVSAKGGPFGGPGIAFAFQVVLYWPMSALLVWAVGNWFGHPSQLGRVLRIMGFAMAPLLLSVVNVVPNEWVRVAGALLSTALLIATYVVGVRQALQTSTGRAAFVCLVLLMTIFFIFMLTLYFASRSA